MDEKNQPAAAAGKAAEGAAAAQAPAKVETPDHVAVGKEFTDWFNDKLNALTRPTITLGTKRAEVIELHPDGRLECEVEGTGSQNEQTFVAFDMTHFEQLIRKITALGL